MKKLKYFILFIIMCITLCSCEVYSTPGLAVTTQDDIYTEMYDSEVRSNVDFNIVIRYGTPYYLEGQLIYYLYNNLYYYPFFYNNYWYVRTYRRPFNHLYYRPYFRPHRYDYKFSPGAHHGFGRPNIHNNYRPGHITPHPGRVNPNRGNIGNRTNSSRHGGVQYNPNRVPSSRGGVINSTSRSGFGGSSRGSGSFGGNSRGGRK